MRGVYLCALTGRWPALAYHSDSGAPSTQACLIKPRPEALCPAQGACGLWRPPHNQRSKFILPNGETNLGSCSGMPQRSSKYEIKIVYQIYCSGL